MAKVALLTHADEQLPRRLLAALDRARAEWFEVRVDRNPLPGYGFDAIVVLGGRMGAYETDAFPWLVEEKDFLRRQVDNSVPVLGICLGAQLLADSLGGHAFLAPTPEVGVVPIQLTDAGRRHGVVRVIGDQVLCVHQDTFELPPGRCFSPPLRSISKPSNWARQSAFNFIPRSMQLRQFRPPRTKTPNNCSGQVWWGRTLPSRSGERKRN